MPLAGMQEASSVVVAVYEVEVLVEVVVSQYSKNFPRLKTFSLKMYISSLSSLDIGFQEDFTTNLSTVASSIPEMMSS